VGQQFLLGLHQRAAFTVAHLAQRIGQAHRHEGFLPA